MLQTYTHGDPAMDRSRVKWKHSCNILPSLATAADETDTGIFFKVTASMFLIENGGGEEEVPENNNQTRKM